MPLTGSAHAPPIKGNRADCDSRFWREQAPTKTCESRGSSAAVRNTKMTDMIFWPLFITFIAIAIGAVLKMVEALHGKKLSDDECSRLRAQLDILNNPKDEKSIDVQTLNGSKRKETLESKKEKSQNILLEDVQVKILSFLWKQPNKTPEEISKSLKIDLEAMKFHLSELGKLGMVQTDTFGDWPTYQVWLLDQEGRRYLIKHKTS